MEGEKSRSGLAGRFCLNVSHEVAGKLLAVAAVLFEGPSEGGPTSTLTHTTVGRPQFFAGCCPRSSVPNHMELSIDSLSVLTMWQVASQRTNDPRERVPDTEATVFLNQVV